MAVDDGSRHDIDEINRQISTLSNCSYSSLAENIGPARLRNYLADHAQYQYLLFLDADVLPVCPTFLADYLQAAMPGGIVCGGFCYLRGEPSKQHALRYYYGIYVEEKTSAERNRHPYEQFISMSFLVDQSVFRQVRFDEAMHVGYEDTYFGILLEQKRIPLHHIDNPVYHLSKETSTEYLTTSPHSSSSVVHQARTMQTYPIDSLAFPPYPASCGKKSHRKNTFTQTVCIL